MQHIGHKIRAALDEKGVTQTRFASDFGVKQGSVADWLKYGRIKKDRLPRLAEYFGKPLEYWLDAPIVEPPDEDKFAYVRRARAAGRPPARCALRCG